MQLNSDFILAIVKLAATFGVMLILLQMKWKLWQAIMTGCLMVGLMAFMGGIPLKDILLVPLSPLQDEGFLLMQLMIFGIMLLSALQGVTGQSQRLVDALDRYIRWPRLRLVIFPALVGFLPMPGGALFSCPMLDAAAHGLEISPKRKTLINYWFRHIWETTWPLYPGFILVCSMVGIPLQALMVRTFPLVFLSIVIGWLFFIRDIKIPGNKISEEQRPPATHPLLDVFYESLPITVTIFGAAAFSALFNALAPALPSQVAFVCSLALGNLIAFVQGRRHASFSLGGQLLNKRTFALMTLIYVIFIFKDMIGVSGIVADMSHTGGSPVIVGLMFIILPLICGMLTGVMVGYVGAAFPILLGIIAEGGLEAYTLPLIVLGISAGQIGQLATPLHVCVVVTCEYYKVHFSEIWRSLIKPLALLLCGGLIWVGVLFALKAQF